MHKKNILFFHPAGLFYGGTEKLLQIMAKYAAGEFNVFYAYSPRDGEDRKNYFRGSGVTLAPFGYKARQPMEPYGLMGMEPEIKKIISQYHIELMCVSVFAHYQFPLNVIPAGMPFVLTSPFGHYATNGNVQKVFVSGRSNLLRLQKRGIKNAELIYDPLDDFDPKYLQKNAEINTVVFGRLGRPDDRIFDPVSIRAFARLEKKYGNGVAYLVLTPPPKMLQMAGELGVKNLILADDKGPDYLGAFYKQTDVLAHARVDGETFGKAIAEAMLAGLPIITHRSRHHNEHLNFINPDFAKYSEPDDVGAYYKNMEWFVENKNLIRPMGRKARQKALELFSPEKIMPKVLETFAHASQSCYYYRPGGQVKGYIILWFNNLTMMPFYLLKLAAYHIPAFGRFAEKIYKGRPVY